MRPVGDSNKLMSQDGIYYGVKMDMHLCQPFGCRPYINIAKKISRKNIKVKENLLLSTDLKTNTISEYNFYRPL